MEKIVLKDEKNPEGSSSSLKAYIDKGVFIIEGYDSGESVKKFFGDWDYEYWIKVPAGHYSGDILSQISNCSSAKQVKEWLEQRGIDYEYTSW